MTASVWSQTCIFILATDFARALLRLAALIGKRAQGRPGADIAPAVRCAKRTRRKPHSSIQVVPITRPSLRDGRTAYAVLSREPSSFWPPSPSQKSPAPRRLTPMPHSRELDRSNDGQDHTVLPYARPAISPAVFPDTVDSAGNLQTRRNLAAPFVRARPRAHRGLPSLPAPFAPDAAASTASPARDNDDLMIAPRD
ncbi:hypothetical protein ABIE73_004582 [Bradyrhizobium yuanmingense]